MMNFAFAPCLSMLTTTFGNSFLDTISSPTAMTVYLIVLMVLVAVLVTFILVALHLIRVKTEPLEADGKDGKRRRKAREPRFANLNRIDMDQTISAAKSIPLDDRQLNDICNDFRNYAAGTLGLYYDIADIRRFIAGMGISKLMILRGISGTGKTSLAYAAGEFFGNPSSIVPIQPMWKERSDIIGYFNEFTKRFNETTLLCKLYEAGARPDVYVTVLDEVNISRIEYYFAEFLSLLEIPDPKKRELDVVSDSWENDPLRLKEGKLLLPENMWFIGTANNDDSTFAISDKVYDRAAVIDLDKKSTPFTPREITPVRMSYRHLNQLYTRAKRSHQLSAGGREKLAELDRYLTSVFRVSFGNRILRQIEEYVPIMIACGGWENGALDDILARKILRKLEQLSPSLIKSEVPALCSFLDQLFGDDALPQCKAYLQHLLKSA